MTEHIHVMAAALRDDQGRILLAQRPEGKHKGGLWEFPGGKLEQGESRDECLIRELVEELGITAKAYRPLIAVNHQYPELEVLLDVFIVDAWEGVPHGREGQPLVWVEPSKLGDYDMPEADVPIVHALQLPDTYLITPASISDAEQFLEGLKASLEAGVRLLQFRVFGLESDALQSLFVETISLAQSFNARVLVNSQMDQLVGDGVHLSSRELFDYDERPVATDKLLAVSCHSAEDLRQALKLQANFAVLSPVLPTRSHPDAEPLGWESFSEMLQEAALPVYALGGMKPELMETAWQNGAQGVAGIRGIWCGE